MINYGSTFSKLTTQGLQLFTFITWEVQWMWQVLCRIRQEMVHRQQYYFWLHYRSNRLKLLQDQATIVTPPSLPEGAEGGVGRVLEEEMPPTTPQLLPLAQPPLRMKREGGTLEKSNLEGSRKRKAEWGRHHRHTQCDVPLTWDIASDGMNGKFEWSILCCLGKLLNVFLCLYFAITFLSIFVS